MTLAMDEIVWAVNPQHDSLDSLAAYLGQFAQDFLGRAGLRCVLEFPLDLPVRLVATEVRHALFLAFKETLHNVIKHAGATEVRVSIELRPDSLALVVRDNGRGFGTDAGGPTARAVEGRIAPGVGLAGIRQRLRQIGGDVALGNDPAGGAVVRMTVQVGNDPGRAEAGG
jgi:signal transduction histidine kinase